MKKLLMLGGAPSQVVAIKRAKEMGYYVITCDYLENNPGHTISDEYHNVSTVDKEAVLNLAKSLSVDGVVCYISDPGIPTAAYVAEKLGLHSSPYDSVKILSNKDLFRSFLQEHRFNVPRSKGFSTLEEVQVDIHHFKLPVMIKPVDSSGSRGVSKIDSIELLPEKIEEALRFSRAKRFIVEEYIEKKGYQIGGECFLVDGEIKFIRLVNNHFDSIHSFLPTGESWPCHLSTHLQLKIHAELHRLMQLLNMKTGPLIFELLVDNQENIYILDIGVRNSGDLTKVIHDVDDIDLIEYTIKAALGEDCGHLGISKSDGYWGYYTIISEKSGLFLGLEIEEQFNSNNVVKYEKSNMGIGRQIKDGEMIGTMLLRFSSMEEMLEMMDDVKKWLRITVEDENKVRN